MFNDTSTLEETAKKLNSISPSFCMSKWMNTTIHLHLGRTHSCHLPPTHKIPLKEIKKNVSSLHNTTEKLKQRKMMLEGKRPSGCSACWDVEDLPGNPHSDRHVTGQSSWVKPFYEKVLGMNWDEHINPTYLEVSFSANCNFKCAYCTPSLSTAWQAEVEKYGGYRLTELMPHNSPFTKKVMGETPIDDEDNPYIDAFWKWWPDLKKDLMVFRITGGEPLLSKDTFKVLDKIQSDPMPELELSVNSNFGIPNATFERFISKIKTLLEEKSIRKFLVHTSVDTYGDQAEYIRNGLDFTRFQQNVETYFESIPEGSLNFMVTFNALSIDNFRPLLEWLITIRRKYHKPGRDILFDIPHLRFPSFMAAQILPLSYRQKMKDLIQFMKEHEHDDVGIKPIETLKMERILKWMEEMDHADAKVKAQLEKDRRNFSLFFKEHDRRRGTDFLTLFPDLKDLYHNS